MSQSRTQTPSESQVRVEAGQDAPLKGRTHDRLDPLNQPPKEPQTRDQASSPFNQSIAERGASRSPTATHARRRDAAAAAGRSTLGSPSSVLNLGSTTLDLSDLSDDQQQAIRRKHAETAIGLQEREVKMVQDLHAFDNQLGTAVHHASEAAREGVVTTITNTHEDSLGQRQIVVGNSDQARSGKMTLSQAGHLRGLSLQMSVLVALGIVVLGGLIALSVIIGTT